MNLMKTLDSLPRKLYTTITMYLTSWNSSMVPIRTTGPMRGLSNKWPEALEKFQSVLTILPSLKPKGELAIFGLGSCPWKLGTLPSTTAGNFLGPFKVTQVSIQEQWPGANVKLLTLWTGDRILRGHRSGENLPHDHLVHNIFVGLFIASAPLSRSVHAGWYCAHLYPQPPVKAAEPSDSEGLG